MSAHKLVLPSCRSLAGHEPTPQLSFILWTFPTHMHARCVGLCCFFLSIIFRKGLEVLAKS